MTSVPLRALRSIFCTTSLCAWCQYQRRLSCQPSMMSPTRYRWSDSVRRRKSSNRLGLAAGGAQMRIGNPDGAETQRRGSRSGSSRRAGRGGGRLNGAALDTEVPRASAQQRGGAAATGDDARGRARSEPAAGAARSSERWPIALEVRKAGRSFGAELVPGCSHAARFLCAMSRGHSSEPMRRRV